MKNQRFWGEKLPKRENLNGIVRESKILRKRHNKKWGLAIMVVGRDGANLHSGHGGQ